MRPLTQTLSISLLTIALLSTLGWVKVAPATALDGAGAVTSPLPGAERFNKALIRQLESRRSRLDDTYQPRTRHRQSNGWATFTNRLFLETSPYLIQHAHNPVNWYPWGDEAFAAARRLKRPVLLSVGYATCHWCHVMEEESFEDRKIAEFLNANFIAVKVDREERPDIDAIYMQAVRAMSGRGGWPMNVWLTPDGQPFYGGTYFPPRDGDRGRMVGFLTLLKRIKRIYDNQGDQVLDMGRRLTAYLQESMNPAAGSDLPDTGLLHLAAQQVQQRYDADHGGVGGAPKFPSSLPIRFLLRYHRRSGDPVYLNMAVNTLKQMAAGGIHDHVAGGFHRYSTDRQWRVPHFEKMLYDNAQLALAYLEAYQVTGDVAMRATLEKILNYVQREMTAPAGGFYSATDADSLTPVGERDEGYYFTWTPQELRDLLGADQAARFMQHYSVTDQGNFEGRSILHRTPGMKIMTPEEQDRTLRLLYRARQQRPAPLKDDKILTSWNALMISAYARAGTVLNRKAYVDQAAAAATFILEHMSKGDRLFRSYRAGEAKQRGFLEDYALLIAALLDLYEATHSPEWLRRAMALDGALAKRFEDAQNGGFFRTGSDHEQLLAREKPFTDGALPSGNAVALLNLLRLGEWTFDDDYRRRAEKGFKAFATALHGAPWAFAQMLLAVDFYLDQPKEIVIVTRPGDLDGAGPFLQALGRTFVPNRILTVAEEGADLQAHARWVPVARDKIALQGKASAYVCIEGTCELPTTQPGQFSEQINQVLRLAPSRPGAPSS